MSELFFSPINGTVPMNRLPHEHEAYDDIVAHGKILSQEALAQFPEGSAERYYAELRVPGAIIDALTARHPGTEFMRTVLEDEVDAKAVAFALNAFQASRATKEAMHG